MSREIFGDKGLGFLGIGERRTADPLRYAPVGMTKREGNDSMDSGCRTEVFSVEQK
jgi:hypothetical protein